MDFFLILYFLGLRGSELYNFLLILLQYWNCFLTYRKDTSSIFTKKHAPLQDLNRNFLDDRCTPSWLGLNLAFSLQVTSLIPLRSFNLANHCSQSHQVLQIPLPHFPHLYFLPSPSGLQLNFHIDFNQRGPIVSAVSIAQIKNFVHLFYSFKIISASRLYSWIF